MKQLTDIKSTIYMTKKIKKSRLFFSLLFFYQRSIYNFSVMGRLKRIT